MPYFMNPMDREFRGTWILGDRHYTVNFTIGQNINSSTLMIAWTAEPYDLSTDTDLTINFAIDSSLKQFTSLTIDVSGATPSATTATEVVTALNNNSFFSSLWKASVRQLDSTLVNPSGNVNTVLITSKRTNVSVAAYISNTGAEKHLHFNYKAPIAELPTYYRRHAIVNDLTYSDSVAMLVELNPGSNSYEATLIDNSGFDSGTIRDDWQLLEGRSGLFQFTSMAYDGSSRLSSSLVYPAGAHVGDLASLTQYQYSGAATSPSIVTVVPYTLQNSDLVTPP